MSWSNCKSGPDVCKLMSDVFFFREKKALKLSTDRVTDLEKQVNTVSLISFFFYNPGRGFVAGCSGSLIWRSRIFIHQTNQTTVCFVLKLYSLVTSWFVLRVGRRKNTRHCQMQMMELFLTFQKYPQSTCSSYWEEKHGSKRNHFIRLRWELNGKGEGHERGKETHHC